MFDGEKNQLNNGCNKKPSASTGPAKTERFGFCSFFFSAGDDTRGLFAFRSLRMLKLDLLPLVQTLVSISFDGGKMHKHILTAVARGDKTIALRVVEPLHGTGLHTSPFFIWKPKPPALRWGWRENILHQLPG